MSVNNTRLAIALAGLWAVFALPITRFIPDSYEPLNFAFWFLLLMYPAWITFGWRWISDNTSIPLKVWVPLVFVALPITLLLDDWNSDAIWIPSATSTVLILLVGQLNGWDTFRNEVQHSTLNLLHNPPLWLVVVILLIASTAVQELTGIYYPSANQALLGAALLAWMMPYIIRRWHLSSSIAWSVVLTLVMLLVYAYR